jgi:molecular chaperone HtpG
VEKTQRGTDVTLHLREGEDELLSSWQLKSIIRKYSDHIQIPIVMKKEEWDKDKGENVVKDEDETINQANALWSRPKSEISKEQYEEFYKHVGHDFDPPLAWLHSKVEGRQEYTQLLYIPSRAPFDLWDRERRHGLKLYVRRVFIMEDAGNLLPNYLRFVRGVVDSSDLPLNVSREMLQQSKDVEAIRAGCVKKVLGLLEDLAGSEEPGEKDKYATFWKQFGVVLKEGTAEDFANKDKIAKLLRFASTAAEGEEQTVSLGDYVSRMKEGQEKIYYVTAESFSAAKNSPHLEIFRKKGIEVLLLSDRVDEWMLTSLTEYEGKSLQSVAKGDLDLGRLEDEAEKKANEDTAHEFKGLVDKVKQALGERVKEVRVSYRLTDSPACLVADAQDLSFNLERLLKAAGQKAPNTKPILELNPTHPLVQRLKGETDGEQFDQLAHLLFDQSVLTEGGQLEDPSGFVKRVNQLILKLAANV